MSQSSCAVQPDFDDNVADVIIYSRYSSAGQNDQSIDGQIDACMRYAAQRGFRVVGQYIDRALSGTHADSRPEFQRMIRDSKKKAFKYVLVWKLDRFARNRYDSAIYKNELKKQGVKVLSVTEGIDAGSDSIILEAVLEAMAEEYSRQLSQNVRRGIRQNAEKHLTIGGYAPLGYRVEDKRLVVDEKEAEIVRFVFHSYANGMTKTEIAKECNRRGWRTKTGRPFSVNSFAVMLKNPTYIGTYTFKDEIAEAGSVPAIVDGATFGKVGAMLERNRRAPGRAKAKEEYQLQGKVFCGYCGAPMVGESGRGRRGATYHYYACATRKKAHTCQKRNEKKGFLEWYIVEQITTHILTEQRIQEIAAGVVAEYNRSFDAAGVRELERKIRAMDKEMDALVDALIRTTAAPAVAKINERVELLAAQKEEAEVDLAKLKVASRITVTEEEIVAWLQQFVHGDPMDPAFRQRVIDIFVNSIFLYDDKVVMYFNIKDTCQISYIEMQENLDELSGSDLNRCGVPKGHPEGCPFVFAFAALVPHRKVWFFSAAFRCKKVERFSDKVQ